jgi:hypothetical protein
MDKQQAMSMLNCSVDQSSLTINSSSANIATNGTGGGIANAFYTPGTTCWDYWQNTYYPQVIYSSYPVYIQERARDKGKQAFEIIKILKDKKLVNLAKVGDFIDLMDELIKIL